MEDFDNFPEFDDMYDKNAEEERLASLKKAEELAKGKFATKLPAERENVPNAAELAKGKFATKLAGQEKGVDLALNGLPPPAGQDGGFGDYAKNAGKLAVSVVRRPLEPLIRLAKPSLGASIKEDRERQADEFWRPIGSAAKTVLDVAGERGMAVFDPGKSVEMTEDRKKKALAAELAAAKQPAPDQKGKPLTTADPIVTMDQAAKRYNAEWNAGYSSGRDSDKRMQALKDEIKGTDDLTIEAVRTEARKQRNDPHDAEMFGFKGEDAIPKTRELRGTLARHGYTPLKFLAMKSRVGKDNKFTRQSLEKAMQSGDNNTIVGILKMQEVADIEKGRPAGYGERLIGSIDAQGNKTTRVEFTERGKQNQAIQDLQTRVEAGLLEYSDLVSDHKGKPLSLINKKGVGKSEINMNAYASVITKKKAELDEHARDAKISGDVADIAEADVRKEQWLRAAKVNESVRGFGKQHELKFALIEFNQLAKMKDADFLSDEEKDLPVEKRSKIVTKARGKKRKAIFEDTKRKIFSKKELARMRPSQADKLVKRALSNYTEYSK